MSLGTFGFPLERARRRATYHVIQFGTPDAMLRDVLKQIEEAVGTPLIGFRDLSIDEIMEITGLSREAALRANLREYDEPFLVQGPDTIAAPVLVQKSDGSYDHDIDVPQLIHAPEIGPIGWNHAMLNLLQLTA